MRPGKGVHLSLDRRHGNYGIICTAVDGRQMFLMPHEMESIIGTTDDDFFGDPDDLDATADEVEYLVDGAASLVPSVRRGAHHPGLVGRPDHALRVRGRGGRPLPRPPDLRPRRRGRRPGCSPSSGGKLASYRAQSEELTDRVVAMLGRAVLPCRTHEVPLPGGDEVPSPRELAARARGPRAGRGAHRLPARVAGPRGAPGRRRRPPHEARPLPRRGDPGGRGGLDRAAREGAPPPGPAAPLPARARGAAAASTAPGRPRRSPARELGWDADRLRAELADLLEVGWRERRPVLDGWQLAEEELLRAVHRGLGGL